MHKFPHSELDEDFKDGAPNKPRAYGLGSKVLCQQGGPAPVPSSAALLGTIADSPNALGNHMSELGFMYAYCGRILTAQN